MSDAKKPSEKNVWVCVNEKVIHDSPFMSMVERNCRSSEDSRPHKFYLFRSRDWTNIIPVTEDGKIVMIRQYRIGISDHTLELPGGVNDPTDHQLRDAAVRELTEETGYVPAENAQMIDLGWSHPNPAIMDNRCHAFAIGPVRKQKEQKLDLGEMIEVVEVPIVEIPAMIQRGEITHALMLTTFLFMLVRTEAGSRALAEALARLAGKPPTQKA